MLYRQRVVVCRICYREFAFMVCYIDKELWYVGYVQVFNICYIMVP